MGGRPPTTDEKAFVDAVLGREFDGVEELREQWKHAVVKSSCQCGCGSLGFVFDDEFQPEPSGAPTRLPVDIDIVDEHGELTGGIIVFVRDGVLNDVDVFSFGAEPLPFPSPSSIRWHPDLPLGANRSASPIALASRSLTGQSGRVRQRGVRPLDSGALEVLTTDRLLAYRSRLLELEDSAATSDLDDAERDSLDPTLIHFKDEPEWVALHATVRSILATRER